MKSITVTELAERSGVPLIDVREVDEFAGENAPLVMAEVELTRIDDEVALPPWVGREVTDDPAYTNAALAQRPYSRWRKP